MTEQADILEAQKPKHGKRVYVYFFLVVISVLSVFVVKAKWQHYVPVKQITVEGIDILSKDDIVRLMKPPTRTSMYDLDLTELQKNILVNSFVKKVVIKRDAPSMLRVIVEERKPSALLLAKEMYYIDSDGMILPYVVSSDAYDIPVISGIDSIQFIRTGQKLLRPDILEALDVIEASKAIDSELFHAISEIHLRKGHDMILYSFDTGFPIIFGKGDVAKKMVKLEAFWKKYLLNNSTDDIQYLDIRFDDQVIVSRKNS